MRVTERKLKHLAVSIGTVTYTHQFHLLAETFAHTYHHVVDKSANQTVMSTMDTVVGRTFNDDMIVINFHGNIVVELLSKLALRTLYSHNVVLDCYVNTSRYFDWQFSYS